MGRPKTARHWSQILAQLEENRSSVTRLLEVKDTPADIIGYFYKRGDELFDELRRSLNGKEDDDAQ